MFVDFYVFKSKYAAEIISKIEQKGYNVYVSADNGVSWLKEHFIDENRHRIYYEGFETGLVSSKCIEGDSPLLCVSVQEDYHSWDKVDAWVDGILDIDCDYELEFEKPATQKRIYNPPGEEVFVDGLKSHVLSIPPSEIDLKNGYSYSSEYDEVKDIKYYEIIAPSSETPFTVVVNNFSKKDDTYLFTDIFASAAWAANNLQCRYDFHFLTVLWKHLGLPGEFTSELLKKRIDSCYPDRVSDVNDLRSEPYVYRRPMKDVMNMKRKKLENHDFIPGTTL